MCDFGFKKFGFIFQFIKDINLHGILHLNDNSILFCLILHVAVLG